MICIVIVLVVIAIGVILGITTSRSTSDVTAIEDGEGSLDGTNGQGGSGANPSGFSCVGQPLCIGVHQDVIDHILASYGNANQIRSMLQIAQDLNTDLTGLADCQLKIKCFEQFKSAECALKYIDSGCGNGMPRLLDKHFESAPEGSLSNYLKMVSKCDDLILSPENQLTDYCRFDEVSDAEAINIAGIRNLQDPSDASDPPGSIFVNVCVPKDNAVLHYVNGLGLSPTVCACNLHGIRNMIESKDHFIVV